MRRRSRSRALPPSSPRLQRAAVTSMLRTARGRTADVAPSCCATVCFDVRSKINLGVGAYGRSWLLADPTQTAVGSPAPTAGPQGACTGARCAVWPGHAATYSLHHLESLTWGGFSA